VIDLSREGRRDGVVRLTEGKGVDVVIDGVSFSITRAALASLAFGGMLVVVGYSGGREATIDVTDLIWRGAQVCGFTFKPGIFSAETLQAARKACVDCLTKALFNRRSPKCFRCPRAKRSIPCSRVPA
jgi:NADPH2:quinone reductase